jgi:hypothetical protein
MRIGNRFFIDCATVLADYFDGDLIMGLVFVAIAEANVAHIEFDSEEALKYAALNAPPPDELRRPVTVYQVSKSLGLTYETTRRYAKKLVDGGYCEKGPHGFTVGAEVLSQPSFTRAFKRNRENFKVMIERIDTVRRLLGASTASA